jgi:diacylglycerol kinase family enzyme
MGTSSRRSVAVILNRNAQRVSPDIIAGARGILGPGAVFVTSSRAEAREAAREIAARRFEVACTGGGDGTFIAAVNDLDACCGEEMPMLMGLRLGSGNAIGEVCGASPPTREGLAADIARAASGEPPRPLSLLRVDGRLTHSTGVGLDAKFNEDFRAIVKNWLGRGVLAPLIHGAPGLVLAAVMRSIPRLLREGPFNLRVINRGAPASLLGGSGHGGGDADRPAGAVLYDGQAVIACASTVATYGRGLRLFPFADSLTDRFQLRVSSVGPLDVLPNLSRIFSGTYRNPRRLSDFAVTAVRLELAAPAPWHVAGDLQGPTTEFDIELSPRKLQLLFDPRRFTSAACSRSPAS